jgi:tetratricopeptide (TPR) repeat protein
MRLRALQTTSCCLILLSAASLAAAGPDGPFAYRLSPLEDRLFADAADGQLDQFSLSCAALVASGVEDNDTLSHYTKRLDALMDELRRSGAVRGTPRQKAEAVFDFLHRRVLTKGYRLESTDLRQALDHGRFNCVSASVLFNCLAREFGLTARGLEVPGHAMSRLRLPTGSLDVETTCARWFKQGNVPTGSPAKSARTPREVTDVELTAMIYYNRGVDLLAEKHFAEAAAADAKALRLDPANATARGNFLATINNWAIDLGATGRYGDAAALLRQGMEIDPHYEIFALNQVHLYRQWVEHLCAAGRFEEADALLAAAAVERPEEGYFRQAQAEVQRRWARAVAGGGK